MDRYTQHFTIAADPNVIYTTLGQYLQSEGYEYVNFNDEYVFKKGKGFVSGPSFFKFSFLGNTMKMEAWIKYALLPGVYISENGDLDSFVGLAVKKALKERIKNIEQIMAGFAPQPQYAPMQQNFPPTIPQFGFDPDNFGNNHTASAYPPPTNTQHRIFCMSCGTEQPEGVTNCISCGAAISNNFNQAPHIPYGNPSIQNSPDGSMPLPPPGQTVNRADFIKKYAPKSLQKDIVNIAILCYVCAGVTALVACFMNPLGIIDALLLLAPAIGMHIKKSRICAIAVFLVSVVECILSVIGCSFPFLWLIAGISALITFNKIEKEYKKFLANMSNYNQIH